MHFLCLFFFNFFANVVCICYSYSLIFVLFHILKINFRSLYSDFVLYFVGEMWSCIVPVRRAQWTEKQKYKKWVCYNLTIPYYNSSLNLTTQHNSTDRGMWLNILRVYNDRSLHPSVREMRLPAQYKNIQLGQLLLAPLISLPLE